MSEQDLRPRSIKESNPSFNLENLFLNRGESVTGQGSVKYEIVLRNQERDVTNGSGFESQIQRLEDRINREVDALNSRLEKLDDSSLSKWDVATVTGAIIVGVGGIIGAIVGFLQVLQQ